jgi:hypothetical protein
MSEAPRRSKGMRFDEVVVRDIEMQFDRLRLLARNLLVDNKNIVGADGQAGYYRRAYRLAGSGRFIDAEYARLAESIVEHVERIGQDVAATEGLAHAFGRALLDVKKICGVDEHNRVRGESRDAMVQEYPDAEGFMSVKMPMIESAVQQRIAALRQDVIPQLQLALTALDSAVHPEITWVGEHAVLTPGQHFGGETIEIHSRSVRIATVYGDAGNAQILHLARTMACAQELRDVGVQMAEQLRAVRAGRAVDRGEMDSVIARADLLRQRIEAQSLQAVAPEPALTMKG